MQEVEVLGVLTALGYSGDLTEERALSREAEQGPLSPRFTAACSWLVSELKAVSLLEECLTPTTGPENAEAFLLEVSGLLSELHCPYPSLTSGSATSRLKDKKSSLQLLQFLGSELQAARLLRSKQPPQGRQEAPKDAGSSDEVFRELQALCRALGLAEPTADAPMATLFRELELKIRDVSSGLPAGTMGNPLLTRSLEPGQWERLEEIHRAMCAEYKCRRQMLISRLDVTVQSFHWSERAQQYGAEMVHLYEPLRDGLCSQPSVTLALLLCAREDLSVITKTTSQSNREKTACAVNKILMGPVPDRGGRPGEIEPPMVKWESRRSGSGGRKEKRRSKGRRH